MKFENALSVCARRFRFGLRRFSVDERGMSTVEYVILLAVIVMGAVGIWTEIGDHVVAALGGSRDAVTEIPTAAP